MKTVKRIICRIALVKPVVMTRILKLSSIVRHIRNSLMVLKCICNVTLDKYYMYLCVLRLMLTLQIMSTLAANSRLRLIVSL